MRIAHSQGRFGAALLTATCVMLGAGYASADSSSASSLFRKGRHLMSAHRYDLACPKIEESWKLDPQQVTAYVLGVCFEHEGKNAQALRAYQAVVDEQGSHSSAHLAHAAQARVQALAPRVAKLTVSVPPRLRGLAGLEVSCDGASIDPASWGSPLPVDPGAHSLQATADGRRPWHTSVQTSAGGSTSVAVGAMAENPSESSPAEPEAAPAPAEADTSSSSSGGGQRALGVVTGLVGIGGLAAGGVFLMNAIAKNDDIHRAEANGECNGMCDPNVLSLASQRNQDATIGIVGLSAGGALLVGGAILYFSAPSTKESDAKPAEGLRMTGVGFAGLTGIRVSGTW